MDTAKEIAIYALFTLGAIGWGGAIIMAVVHYVWTQKRMKEIRKRERIWK
jgi:hypothetical protein